MAGLASASLNVLFFGSNAIAIPALRALIASRDSLGPHPGLIRGIQLVCPCPKPYRGALKSVPTRDIATESGIPIHDLPPEIASLREWQPQFLRDNLFDVGVVASFGFILRPAQLTHLAQGAVNIHPSLLPKYRGPCPLEHTLLNGDSTTGVTIIDVSPRIDAGAILAQQTMQLTGGETLDTLCDSLGLLGAELLMGVLSDLPTSRQNGKPQVDALASKAGMLKPERIVWADMTSTRLHNECRGRAHRSSLFTTLGGEHVVVYIRSVDPSVKGGPPADAGVVTRRYPPGSLYFDKSAGVLWVKCADRWVSITSLIVPKGKKGSTADFMNGYNIPHLGATFV